MKKIIIVLIMLTSMQSQGVKISEDSTGQVLIFPYYTVNNDFDSLLTITNTTQQAKALRVRFREAANSREVFTFNLYLGANDVWVAGIIKTEDSAVKLITPDNSCTVPNLQDQQNLFSKSHFTNDMLDAYGDNDNRLFEGFIEVIEMGELTGDSAQATVLDSGEVPPSVDCSRFTNAWDINHAGNYWVQDATTDLLPPAGGISGDLTLINVPKGVAMNAKPTVIDSFSNEILHFNPESDSPSLADGMLNSRIVDKQGRSFDIAWDSGIKALSSVLMVSSFANEFEINSDFGAKTTWITTLPTKQYFTDPLYAQQAPIAPFTQALNTQINCENFESPVFYSRETQSYTGGTPLIGGTLTPPPSLCFSTNTLSFEGSATNSIFSSNFKIENISETFTPLYSSGWMRLSFNQSMVQNNTNLMGLPVIGFSTQTYQNGTLTNSTLANYGVISEHKNSLQITQSPTLPQVVPSKMKLSSDGAGQVLIYPYYTVKNGFDSLLSLVNTTDDVKAVRIKFREGSNARNTLDFNIYLSPYDVWTAALVQTDSTLPDHIGEPSVKLLTNDSSCVVPNSISTAGHEFLPYGYEIQYDGKGRSLARVQEGFIEVIEMGSLTGSDAIAATHIAGIPPSCEALQTNFQQDGKWFSNSNQDIDAPNGGGGLYGSLSLINVAKGIDMKYDAVAITGYSTEAQHTSQGMEIPNLSSGNNSTTVINDSRYGNPISTTWNSPLDAVSALFMHDTTSNQYDINSFAAAQTDWVIMSPTRHFYTDTLYNADNPSGPYATGLVSSDDYCQEFSFHSFNREQKLNVVFGPVPSPNPPGNYDQKLCYSINVGFADNSTTFLGTTRQSIFDSQLLIEDWIVFNGTAPMYHMEADEGVLRMNLDDGGYIDGVGAGDNTESHRIHGKPIISFTAQKYVNGKLANDVLANYSVIKEDTTTRKIEGVAPAQ